MLFFDNERKAKKINFYAPWVAIGVVLTIGGLFFIDTIMAQSRERNRAAQELVENYYGNGLNEKRMTDIQKSLALESNITMQDIYSKEYCKFLNKIGRINYDCANKKYTIDRSIRLNAEEKAEARAIVEKVEAIHYEGLIGSPVEADINKILSFYRSAITCVESKKCSEEIIFNTFQGPMTAFVNLYCNYFGMQGRRMLGIDSGADDFIVRYLLDSGLTVKNVATHDKSRQAIFRCERHRKMEQEGGV